MFADQSGLHAIDYDSAVRMHRTVQPEEIDVLGHVNNAVYIGWLQDIAVGHWDHVVDQALHDSYIWVCHRHEVDYRVPLLEGEDVEVRTWLGALSAAKFNRHTDIRKVGATRWSVQAVTTWVMLEKDTGRPKRIGDEVLNAFGVRAEELGRL